MIRNLWKIISELSPLKNLHKETLDFATNEFINFLNDSKKFIQLNRPFKDEKTLFNLCINDQILKSFNKLSPSVKFAIESMLLHLKDKLPKGKTNINSAYLFDDNNKGIKNSVIKLKIRPNTIDQNINDILNLQAQNNLLRLDGNNSLSSEELNQIIQKIDCKKIQYIEDTFTCLEEELKFNNLYPKIDLAIDLMNFNLKNYDQYNYIVLKPNLLGSISELFRRMVNFENSGKRLVLSSCFEGEFGHSVLEYIYLNKHYFKKQTPGFDTKNT